MAIVRTLAAGLPTTSGVPLDTRPATAFQHQVWTALRHIPRGETRSYRDIAREIGRPTAIRAVANACANNPVALLIPCHRVTRANGTPGGYRWGTDRKQQLLTTAAAPPSSPRAPPHAPPGSEPARNLSLLQPQHHRRMVARADLAL